ncbi:hypothetical protein ABIA69_003970 [Lysinibacillus parviboronicapiens]|uniref:Adenylyltransferase AadA C-terminal domain-containing protein n=1 Tax=Lysinibacillus parviboronicapiens TaxID=436516 RepID=A0ABV2PPQ2_9BACI
MNVSVPTPVQNILNDYISNFQKQIPHTLEALYLHGSIALNAYTEGSSDIDFIAVMNRSLTESDVKVIAVLHKDLNQKYKKIAMDGSYLPVDSVGKEQAEVKNCLYVNEGKIKWSNDGINPVTWWILKNNGITIMGPDVTTLDFNVDESILVDYVKENMNTYWLNRLKTMKKYKTIAFLIPNKFIDREVAWSITGMLRQFYTLREHNIASKIDASSYAINHIPERWHNIINEAVNIQEGINRRYCKSKKQRIEDTIQCMNYILNTCNSMNE